MINSQERSAALYFDLARALVQDGPNRDVDAIRHNDVAVTQPASGNRRTIPTTEGATTNTLRENRKVIPVSCGLHRSPRGFANLVVKRKHNGEIVFAPHVTGACVIIFDEDAATALFEVFRTWLRR